VHNALQKAISYPSVSITNMLRENAPAYVAEKLVESEELKVESEFRTQVLFPDERIVPLPNSQLSVFSSQLSPDCFQLDKSYIVCEHGQSLLIIDQHRAHKLLLYERALQALQNGDSLNSQELLFPESIEIPAYLSPILEAQKNELKKLGFHIEPFGSNTWRLRGIPAHLRIGVAGQAIISFLENINESKESNMFKRNALSFANSSAIPNGVELSPQEMKNIISDLLSLQNPYETPKGEAIFMRMPIEDIKRKF
jgi:DNA mismatch repair protein MutL